MQEQNSTIEMNHEVVDEFINFIAKIKKDLGVDIESKVSPEQIQSMQQMLTNLAVVIGAEMIELNTPMLIAGMTDDNGKDTWATVVKLIPPIFIDQEVDIHRRLMTGEFDEPVSEKVIITPAKQLIVPA